MSKISSSEFENHYNEKIEQYNSIENPSEEKKLEYCRSLIKLLGEYPDVDIHWFQDRTRQNICKSISEIAQKLTKDENKIKVLAEFKDVWDLAELEELESRYHTTGPGPGEYERCHYYSLEFFDNIIDSIKDEELKQEFENVEVKDGPQRCELAYEKAMKIREKENEVLDIPYNKVAKAALMNWNGLIEEEAEKVILESSFEELESKVYAKGSIDYAILAISRILNLEEASTNELIKKTYFSNEKYDPKVYLVQNGEKRKSILELIDIMNPAVELDILSRVHDGWVTDNSKKFFQEGRNKQYQHLPIELIGWEEAKSDLLFVAPILEKIEKKGKTCSYKEQTLKEAYEERQIKWLFKNNIKTSEDLVRFISSNPDFYLAIEGQDGIKEAFSNSEFVKDILVPQIENKIGNIENLVERETKRRLDIPYNKVAKKALMEWNGLSEEEAERTILVSSFKELESMIGARKSINTAIRAFCSKARLSGTSNVENRIYNGVKIQKDKYKKIDIKEDDIIEILSDIHNQWVEDNEGKFLSREKKHQHMPIELIGWKELKSDLLFLKPILEAYGVEVNEENLENAYNKRVDKFIITNDIKSNEDLANLIAKGTDFYPALKGQEEILNTIKNPAYVLDTVIPQIEEKGIGSVETIRKRAVKSVELDSEILENLTEEELEVKEKVLDKKNEELTIELDELTGKQKRINSIREKMELHRKLQEQIKEEKLRQAKEAKTYITE